MVGSASLRAQCGSVILLLQLYLVWGGACVPRKLCKTIFTESDLKVVAYHIGHVDPR